MRIEPEHRLAAWRNAYVFPPVCNGKQAAFVWNGGVVVFAHTARGVEVVADLRGTPTPLSDARGFEIAGRHIMDGGGCSGCNNPLKRLTWETVEAHIGSTESEDVVVT